MVTAYVDANHPVDRPVSGGVVFLGTTPISWWSERQNSAMRSTADSETMAMSVGVKKVQGVIPLYNSFFGDCDPVPIDTDNRATFYRANTMQVNSGNAHIMRHVNVITDCVGQGLVKINSCRGKANVSDMLTKGLPANEFEKYASMVVSGIEDKGCEEVV